MRVWLSEKDVVPSDKSCLISYLHWKPWTDKIDEEAWQKQLDDVNRGVKWSIMWYNHIILSLWCQYQKGIPYIDVYLYFCELHIKLFGVNYKH